MSNATGRTILADLAAEVAEEIGPRSWVHLPAGLTHAIKALEPSVMILTLLNVS